MPLPLFCPVPCGPHPPLPAPAAVRPCASWVSSMPGPPRLPTGPSRTRSACGSCSCPTRRMAARPSSTGKQADTARACPTPHTHRIRSIIRGYWKRKTEKPVSTPLSRKTSVHPSAGGGVHAPGRIPSSRCPQSEGAPPGMQYYLNIIRLIYRSDRLEPHIEHTVVI